MKSNWDVIIIGARIAGSTLASYLGGVGLRVLLLDRARFPADIPQQASWDIKVNRLWDDLGILPSIEKTGTPRQTAHYYATDDVVVPYSYASIGQHAFRMTARRIKLDTILAQHATSFSSVELRTGFPVHRLLWEGDRVVGICGGERSQTVTETAPLVVGADGQHSWLGRQVSAVTYEKIPSRWASYFAYYRNTNTKPEVGHYARTANAFFVAIMADEGLLTVNVSIQDSELDNFRHNLPRSFEERLRDHPYFRAVIGDGKRESIISGACHLKMYKRIPYGPGWALVGDAGYHLDPMAAKGVTAATVSARLLADAICSAFAGNTTFEEALHQYHQERDQQLAQEWAMTHRAITKGPPGEEDRIQARFLIDQPELRRLQMLAQFGFIPMTEFNQAVSNALKPIHPQKNGAVIKNII
jgi:flavin-dependent dehydrogenase